MEIKKKALKILNEVEVKQTWDSDHRASFLVGEERVSIFNRPGRTLVSCSCENHARFCNEQPLCKHKLAAISVWMDKYRTPKIILALGEYPDNPLEGWEETTEKETEKLEEKDFAIFTTNNELRYFKRRNIQEHLQGRDVRRTKGVSGS